ncbi:hypothetical protein AAG906_011228 [Vitis piasezkii]
MRTRLGPQGTEDLGRQEPQPGHHARSYGHPMVRACTRIVTPWSPHDAQRSLPPGATYWEKPPKRATHWLHQKGGRHALHALLLSYHSLRAPRDSSYQNFLHTMGPMIP